MHSRLGFLLVSNFRTKYPLLSTLCSSTSSLLPSSPPLLHRTSSETILPSTFHSGQIIRYLSSYSVDQFSDDDYECDYENHPASSSVANIDEWRWKLSMLLRNDTDQEIVSRDKRDKRDFEQISNLAKRMGLFCEMYGKVVVASKRPLPNYRPDLDDKRPQREVVIPLSLQRRVEGLLQEHLDRMQLNSVDVSSTNSENSNQAELVNQGANPDPLLEGNLMESVLQRRSLQMRNRQRTWEGFTHPVRAHFLEDILEITGYKLTPFNQIDEYGQEKLWKTQRQLVPRKKKNNLTLLAEAALSQSSFEHYSSKARDSLSCWIPDSIGFNLIEAVLCHICRKERPGAVLVFMTGWDDICFLKKQLKAHPLLGDPNRVQLLTCHGSMATSEQKLIFEKPPPNVRKIVLATNMAEASITINDVVFVVDCGKAKETTYDALNNTPCLLPSWISQASARQRRGRAGRVQPGDCYHLYPRCVYHAFSEYQLPELLRTPLNSLCLQIKSLQVGSIGEFLSAALQPPAPLAVQNAVDFLKIIGALDENENLTHLGEYLAMLPLDPKLGKMLIMGAFFRCFDPILTIVAGLSVKDPFLLPQDKKDQASTAKSKFSAKDYSDHMALVRAYEGWKEAEREGSAYEYCWRNYLSAQTLQAMHSLRNQFHYILKDAQLLEADASLNNRLSHNQSLVRAIICAGLFPGIASVVHRETSMSFKTMDDGQVGLYANSVNTRYETIPYSWLVFGEKVKVNTVYIRDSTGVSDSILILFGGGLVNGVSAGHLKMLGGYIDFFMDPTLAETYVILKQELDQLLQKKVRPQPLR
ncbi:hypothetical protein M8C21_021620 [Ambrosia artemisiifolia]|uniref:RNA helicase n=1 Tax=Ambrosia artemisiifolia TaxID=4212 RepID=A0AAD5G1M6_AMBAR|nr:hypothetical protein M8C21_021620 [Ambrosia artemisiifolia]